MIAGFCALTVLQWKAEASVFRGCAQPLGPGSLITSEVQEPLDGDLRAWGCSWYVTADPQALLDVSTAITPKYQSQSHLNLAATGRTQ